MHEQSGRERLNERPRVSLSIWFHWNAKRNEQSPGCPVPQLRLGILYLLRHSFVGRNFISELLCKIGK
jgi:hypothetical protein